MKPWPSLLLIGMLLSIFAAAACGSGDGSSGGGGGGAELSLEQYFDQVGSIIAGLEERAATLNQPLDQEFDSGADEIEAAREAFASVLPAFQEFIDDLDDLNPPDEAAGAHGDLVAGFNDLVGGLEDLIDQLVDIDSITEFSALLFDPDSSFGSAIGQLAAACLDLQGIADSNEIDVDLDCTG